MNAGDPRDITALRHQIDTLDAEILRLVQRRTEIARQICAVRLAAGGPRIVDDRERDVVAHFRDLGLEGRELALLLLRLGRGGPDGGDPRSRRDDLQDR